MTQVKSAAIRGGLANLFAQGFGAVARIVSIVVLARLLDPGDFGMMAMVTSTFGILNLFKDLGLSTATIQRGTITDRELSALFWLNIAVGCLLAGVTAIGSLPASRFYSEPRLIALSCAFSVTFLLDAVAIQHVALLSRQMRFVGLAVINSIALLAGISTGIAMAFLGFGYWSLLGVPMGDSVCRTVSVWLYSGWRPGKPARLGEIRGLLHTGSIVTLNGVVMHVADNLDKVLIGRAYGPVNLGLYSRAQQLVNFPVDMITNAIGTVLMSTLSRVKTDQVQLKNYFLKSYSLLISISAPTAVLLGILAEDVILVLLGPKWLESAPIFRSLAPAALIFAALRPMYSLLIACNLVKRSLHMALVLAPVMIIGYTVGMQWGPAGAGAGLSLSLAFWSVPHIAWTLHKTPIGLGEVLVAIGRPLLAAAGAAVPVIFLLTGDALAVYAAGLRVLVSASVFVAIYALLLLIGMRQWALFKGVLEALTVRATAPTDGSTKG